MRKSPVADYLAATPAERVSLPMLSYLANLEQTAAVAPEIAASVVR